MHRDARGVIDATREDFAPAVHQQHAIGDALDEIHLVRAEDDGGAVGAELAPVRGRTPG